MRHVFSVRIGPIGFRIGSQWRGPIATLRHLYAGYPGPEGDIADFTVRLHPPNRMRHIVRPSVVIDGDFTIPEAAPLPLAHGLLAAEMGMNLQMALGARRHLLLHASAVERDGRAVLMSGMSGAGKSTLAALLAQRGWRLLGDEFALLDLDSGAVHAFPRLISLKNQAIPIVEAAVPNGRFGPLLRATPKGDIRHLVPPEDAIARMAEPARPAMILFPRFGFDTAERAMGGSEVFVRLTQASTNYVALGERGFDALTRLVQGVPACAMDYPDTETGIAMVERLWSAA